MNIDWRGIADTIGTINWTEHGRSEKGGTQVGIDALIQIIGDAALRDAVDFYVTMQPGFELARSVLLVLRPPAAMERCREIALVSGDEQEAADAANLLQVIADRRVAEWLPELIASKNDGVRAWTVGIIDQLLIMREEVELEEVLPLLCQALEDPCEAVESRARQVLEFAEEAALRDGRAA